MASPAYRHHTGTAYVGSGTSVTLTKPTGTAAGDSLLLIVYLDGLTSLEAITWPSGFVAVPNVHVINTTTVGKEVQISAAVKVAGGSEPANYAPSWGSSRGNIGRIAAYSGGAAVSPIEASQVNSQLGSGADVTCPSVTAVTVDTLLVCFPANWEGSGAGWTESTDLTLRETTGAIVLADVAVAGTGATGTRVVTAGGASAGRIGSSVLIRSLSGITLTPATGLATLTGFAPNLTATASAALSGTIISATTETDIVNGGKTIIITVAGTTWVP